MIDVRHTAGAVSSKRRELILVARDDHDMRTDMEVLVRRLVWRILVRYPSTGVHTCDAYPVDVSRSPCKALLQPFHEDPIKASGFVMRVAGHAGKASPFRRPLAEDAVFTIRSGWPIENRRASRNEGGSSPQRVRDLLGIRRRMTMGRGLGRRSRGHRGERQKRYQLHTLDLHKECLCSRAQRPLASP